MIPRPTVRLPLWAAFVLAFAAYVVRSAMRGFDFAPDLPVDGIVFVALVVVVGLVAWVRADGRRDGSEDSPVDATDPES